MAGTTKAEQRIIVVLGQSLNPDGTAPATLLARSQHARELAETEGCAVVLTGGDPADTGTSEAEIMRRLLAGVDNVHLEDASQNTCQNAAGGYQWSSSYGKGKHAASQHAPILALEY